MIHFRLATNADCPAAQTLVASVLAEYGLKFEPTGADARLSNLETHYLNAGGWFMVAEDAGKVVATAGLLKKSNEVFELEKMYLLKPYRGQGIGREFFKRALDFARSSGGKRIELDTSSKLKEAVAMYEKYGFKRKIDVGVERCDRSYYLEI
jgi:putative acetyltransferase